MTVEIISKDWPNERFVQDFKSDISKDLVNTHIKNILLSILDNVHTICGCDFERHRPDQKAFTDTISLLQTELLSCQDLCKQQQLTIEALREELADKNKQLIFLKDIVSNQTALNEKYNRMQQGLKYEKEFRKVEAIKQPALIDDEFWRIEGKHEVEDVLDKGLWINKLDADIDVAKSMPVLPQVRSPALKFDKPQLSRNNLNEQRDKYLKILQNKQPIGRDGKRLPLPAIPNKSSQSALSLKKSAEFRPAGYTGFS